MWNGVVVGFYYFLDFFSADHPPKKTLLEKRCDSVKHLVRED